MISAVTQIPHSPSISAQVTQSNDSSTTWKTHAYVVLGYVLIGIGIAFVAASLYMSTVLHPLLALSVPAPLIAAGSLLLSRNTDSPLVPAIFSASPPIFQGISNEGGNDCWINASMQLLFHLPAFSKRLYSSSRSWYTYISNPLRPLHTAQSQYDKGEAISSTLIRGWLRNAKVTSTDGSQQDDPAAFLNYVFQKMGYQLPTMYEKQVSTQGGKILHKSEKKTSPANPLRFFNLAFYKDPKDNRLEAAFDRFFHHIETTPSGIVRTTINFFSRPPEDFLVSIGQAAEHGAKVNSPIECPFDVTLDAAKIGEETQYTCDGFVYHSGRTAQFGHWEAVIRLEGKWWNASDSNVREISEADARRKLQSASFIHYAKTS